MSDLSTHLSEAETIHRRLRGSNPAPGNLDEKAELLREILPALAEAQGWIESHTHDEPLTELRRTLLALRVDAELFAGRQTEAEGYRNADDVWVGYERLRGLVASSKPSASARRTRE